MTSVSASSETLGAAGKETKETVDSVGGRDLKQGDGIPFGRLKACARHGPDWAALKPQTQRVTVFDDKTWDKKSTEVETRQSMQEER